MKRNELKELIKEELKNIKSLEEIDQTQALTQAENILEKNLRDLWNTFTRYDRDIGKEFQGVAKQIYKILQKFYNKHHI